MEKKSVSILCAGLLLLMVSACQKKQTCTVCPDTVSKSEPVAKEESLPKDHVPTVDKKSRPIFDDELEGFVLEDENGNAFAPDTEETEEDINVVEQDVADDVWFDKRSDRSNELGLKTVYFDFDEHGIRPDQKPVLEYDLKKVKELTEKGTVVVEGHACRYAGSALYNMMLSEKRAKKVADFLIKKGVPGDKLKVVGRGYEMCVVADGDIEQQAPNRRVEFYVLD